MHLLALGIPPQSIWQMDVDTAQNLAQFLVNHLNEARRRR